MTGTDPYDAPLSAIRGRAGDLGTWLAIWEARHEPDAHARRCASDAVDAIDAALRDLHALRSRLVGEIRASDDATAARMRCWRGCMEISDASVRPRQMLNKNETCRRAVPPLSRPASLP